MTFSSHPIPSHPIPLQPQWLPDIHAGDSPLFVLLEDDAVSATSTIAVLPTDDEPTVDDRDRSRGRVAEESEDDKAAVSGLSDLPPAGSSRASNSDGDASASTSIVNSSTGHVSDSERVRALEEQNRELLARIAELTKQCPDPNSNTRGNINSTSSSLPAALGPPLSPSSATSEVSKMIEDMSKQRVSCTAFDIQPAAAVAAAAGAALVGTGAVSGEDFSATSTSVQGKEGVDPLAGVDALLAQVSPTTMAR